MDPEPEVTVEEGKKKELVPMPGTQDPDWADNHPASDSNWRYGSLYRCCIGCSDFRKKNRPDAEEYHSGSNCRPKRGGDCETDRLYFKGNYFD